jgi:hypothetical protein
MRSAGADACHCHCVPARASACRMPGSGWVEGNGRKPVTCPLHNHKSPNSTSESVEPSGLLSVGTALATLACSVYVSFDAGGACVSTTHQSPWASARPVALWSVTVAAYTPVPSSTEIETSTSTPWRPSRVNPRRRAPSSWRYSRQSGALAAGCGVRRRDTLAAAMPRPAPSPRVCVPQRCSRQRPVPRSRATLCVRAPRGQQDKTRCTTLYNNGGHV